MEKPHSPRFGIGAGILALLMFAVFVGATPFGYDVTGTQWPLLALFGLVSWIIVLLSDKDMALGGFDAAVGALIALSAVSLVWSPDPVTGCVFVVKSAAIWLLVIALRALYRPHAMLFFAGAIATASVFGLAALFLVPDLTGFVGGFGNPNFQAEFLLMALPWIAAAILVSGHAVLKVAFASVLAAVAWHLAFGSDSKIVILVLAAAPAIVLSSFALRRRRLLLWLAPVALAIAVLAYLRGASEFVRSLNYRGEILYNTLQIWLDYPVFGAGAGSFNALYPLYQERHLDLLPGSYLIRRNYLVGAAHNEFLQLAVQLGAAGLALAALAAWFVRREWQGRAENGVWQWAALISLLNGTIAALVGFPFQMPTTLFLAALALGLLTAPGAASKPGLALSQWLRTGLAACALVLLAGAGYGGVRGAMAQADMRWAILLREAGPDSAFDFHQRAADLAPWDGFIVPTAYLTRALWQARADQSPAAPRRAMFPHLRDPLADGAGADAAWFARSLYRMPNGPNLRLARLQYLLNARQVETSRDEIDAHFAFLERYGRFIPEARMLDIYFGLLVRDPDRAQRGLDLLKRNRFASNVAANIAVFENEISQLHRAPDTYRFVGIVHLTW